MSIPTIPILIQKNIKKSRVTVQTYKINRKLFGELKRKGMKMKSTLQPDTVTDSTSYKNSYNINMKT